MSQRQSPGEFVRDVGVRDAVVPPSSCPLPISPQSLPPIPMLMGSDTCAPDPTADDLRRVERERQRRRRARETPAERDDRLARARQQRAQRRERETSTEREARLAPARVRRANSRVEESLELRAARQTSEAQRHVRRNQTLSSDVQGAAFFYRPYIDYSAHPFIDIGQLSDICTHCEAKTYKGEADGLCCAKGKVWLPPVEQPPEPLLTLFSGSYPDSRRFLTDIRRYNSCFQMTSFGFSGSVDRNGYQPTFRIQGQVYHRIGSLLPLPDAQPQYIQIYFMGDASVQLNQRCNMIQNVQQSIVANFQDLLEQHNRLIRIFRTALDMMPTDQHRVVIRGDRTPAGEHERRFNAPTIDEVAIVMVDGEFSRRDIVIHRRDTQLQRIYETHPSYDALQYPLIFWRGNETYHFNIMRVDPVTKLPTNKKVSAMDYYAHQLMIRNDYQNFILKCGQLLNQFVVDMYAKIEAERLRYIRLNQSRLRADDYIHLRDAVANDGDTANLGQQLILPATFTGSPRHMHEYTQDAMAYVRLHGRPDLFITVTCNPRWREIQELLMPSQLSAERNDLTARVFRQKLLKLMAIITKHSLFGPTRCWMYSIEWQKRGLPHAHILIWLQNRIRPEQLDSVISAEIPDPQVDPTLYQMVLSHMVHGPCVGANRHSPCLNDTKDACKKGFPKRFLSQTVSDIDGYPLYRRRKPEDGGHTAELGGTRDFTVDNRWIVPYCPILLKMFNAHINVEYCNSVKSIKYICKYVNKGSDMANIQVEPINRNDEIAMYQLGRYINSNEAFWRIFSFPIHDRYPTVVHLSVHLENGQRVYFRPENAAAVAEHPSATTLTAFFDLCRSDPFAGTLLYADVPRYYTWNPSSKRFSRRRVGNVVEGFDGRASDAIGRVYTVHPRNRECFFLRMLLTKVRGPTSFEDLRTVEGQVCRTYQEACLIRGLLESDTQWEQALQEAASTRMPVQLRTLFCVIITTCEPSNPAELWENFKRDLSEDILLRQRRMNLTLDLDFTEAIFNEALIMIEDICLRMVSSPLSQLGPPSPDRSHTDLSNSETLRETSYDAVELQNVVSLSLPNLVQDQRSAFDTIIEAISIGRGGMFFLDAPGGTGKTFLLNLILAYVRQMGDIILAVASSGIAATLLAGGRTAHSALKLPLDVSTVETPVCQISGGSAKAQMLRRCKAIIWDECTMSHKKSLEAVDRTLRDLRGDDSLFGGVVVILAGDFRQTLPVIPRSTPADELNACLKQSCLWRHVRVLHLTTNMRVLMSGDPNSAPFSEWLLSIGNGIYPSDPTNYMITLPGDFCRSASTIEELIERVFPNLHVNVHNKEWLCERAILAPTNEMVDQLNSCIQDRLTTHRSMTYLSVDQTLDEESAVHYPIEFLNSLTPSGFPPHELTLRVGSPIMLLRNLKPPQLVNGTRLVVKNLRNHLIEGTILVGPFKGEQVFIPRIPLIPTNLVFSFKRLQFPVRLAFGMTINKSQGQTLKVVGLQLSMPCFSHGQLYVACSRVGNSSNIFVLTPEGKTKNIVYPQALR